MVCDTQRKQETPEERRRRVDNAIASLADGIKSKLVKVKIGPKGEIAFDGWKQNERGGLSDACTLRLMKQRHGFLISQAIAAAEITSGRKLELRAVNSGVHSHDGGNTWHPNH